MIYQPRDYQQDAHDKAIAHLKKSTDSQALELPCGAGKSVILSMIAKTITELSGKKVLISAPSAKLVQQNHEKYVKSAGRASIFCASLNQKNLNEAVVFGSPITLLNSLDKLSGYAALLLDECDLITPSVKKIIDRLKTDNPNLRVIGVTASPYRLQSGYIYKKDARGRILTEDEAIKPYFDKLTFKIKASELIEKGYLTPPELVQDLQHYDTSGLVIDNKGQFTSDSVDKCFVGHGRLTSSIVADIVEKSAGKRGVMIFGSTEPHCREIMASLPPELSCLAISANQKDRLQAEADFTSQRKKYIVNISTQSVGNDYPHADVIALLRKSESPRFITQILGRGTRLYEGKESFLVLDYAENISTHFPNNADLFSPLIKTKKQGDSQFMPVSCPECNHVNQFAMKPNPDKMPITGDGYFTDLLGVKIEPAHFGRRCKAVYDTGECGYFFVSKECDFCQAENDIAAKFCGKCYAELCDPNKPLTIDTASTFAKLVPVVAAHEYDHISKAGNQCKKVVFALADKSTAIKYYSPHSTHKLPQREYKKFKEALLPYSLKLTQVGENWEVTGII